MKALILAAGKGTRLLPITNYVPKPMLPVQGKPLMEWTMLPLIHAGIRDFVVAVSYLAEQIENYFGDGSKWGVRIDYSASSRPAGKAGEIWQARSLLSKESGPFLVVPGDTICHLNYNDFLAFHHEHSVMVSVAFSSRYHLEVGTAEMDDNYLVTKFNEKSNLGKPVSTGAYILDEHIFPYIEAFQPDQREVDLPGDVFPRLLENGMPIYGYLRDYAWWDVGRIDDYEKIIRLAPSEAAQILPWLENHEHFQTL